MAESNHYELLKVQPNADTDTIKRAYRTQIRLYHPDKFAADIARLQKNGDSKALHVLQGKAECASQQTQRLNAAYATLMDKTKRDVYDRQLSHQRTATYQQEIRKQRSREPEYGRRTVKSRRHRSSPFTKVNQDKIPWVILVVLIIFSFFVFSRLTRFGSNTFAPHVPHAPTAEGIITAYELQATQDVLNATHVARTRVANRPTATPLNADHYERAADRLYAMDSYSGALDMYGQAIALNPQNATLYYKRGLVFLAQVETNDDAAKSANADFTQALRLDDSLSIAYRERGLLNFALWQQSASDSLAKAARIDLEHYSTLLDTPDSTVEEALEMLASSVGD
jgi:curved DNA-binding protein CbpA